MRVPVRAGRMGEIAVAVWRLARPAIWLVSILPFLIGYVLASSRPAPRFDRVGDLLTAIAVVGPLSWAAALLLNDVHDTESDRRNPRRAGSPLLRGRVTAKTALAAALACAAIAVSLALTVGVAFAAIVATFLLLCWAYSAPPLRLKEHPGADVAVNVLGVGVLMPAAGWALVHPLRELPPALLIQSALIGVGLYVPSTIVDLEADRAAGYRTVAVVLGRDRAYRLGWGAWLASNAVAVVLCLNGIVVPRSLLPLLIVALPLMAFQYHGMIGRARTQPQLIRGLVTVSVTFLLANVGLMLRLSGAWPE
ncbi:MAG: UbiA family prenyltransferase [Actinomycetota bacterium]